MIAPTDGIFDSYNARFLSPESVADTFVPSTNFAKLLLPGNSLVIGPRGSGKTSLLKMLKLSALQTWRHSEATQYIKKLSFTSIFVPTDRIWAEQLDSLEKKLSNKEAATELVTSIVTINVLLALIDSFSERLRISLHANEIIKPAELSDEKEKIVSKFIKEEWKITSSSDSMRSVRMGLLSKLTLISEILSEASIKEEKDILKTAKAKGIILADMFVLVSNAISIFDTEINDESGRWALCFDETELAPEFLKDLLQGRLRTTHPKLYLKQSMSPYDDRVNMDRPDLMAAEGDDFQVIPLWYSQKQEGFEFSKLIAAGFLARNGFDKPVPEEIFGRSLISSESSDGSYGEDSIRQHNLEQLAEKDNSFARYLVENKISLKNLPRLKEEERAQLIRKIYPVVVHRNFFLRRNRSRRGLIPETSHRSRKMISLYTGWEALAAIFEGNPRWIIGMITNMIAGLPAGSKKIPPNTQWREIEAARHRLRSKIKVRSATEDLNSQPLLKLVDLIGEYFSSDVFNSKFKAEPCASFIVDQESMKLFGQAIGVGVNAGVFVYVPRDKGKEQLKSLTSKRFRICYLLATQYSIPLRIGSHLSLKAIMTRTSGENQLSIKFEEND